MNDVDAWKDEFGDVYASPTDPVEGKYTIWRCLTRPEYGALSKQLDKALAGGMDQIDASMANEDSITELCVLFPPYDRRDPKNLAGYAKRMANDIMEMSGFVEVEVRKL